MFNGQLYDSVSLTCGKSQNFCDFLAKYVWFVIHKGVKLEDQET